MVGCGKMTYQTRDDAKYALNHLSKNNLDHNRSSPVRYYFCDICNGWHLTKKKNEQKSVYISLSYFDKWKKLLKGDNK